MSKDKQKSESASKTGVLMGAGLVTGVVFLPTAVLLTVGMMPSLVSLVALKGKSKIRAVTIGAMNFSGLAPFLFKLWTEGHTIQNAFAAVTNPLNIVIMYLAAAVGVALDWTVTGIVSSILYQKGLSRQKYIARRQKELTERWGPEITGQFALDENGFRIGSGET